ncbi:hypothetical protein [Nocardia sp. Marseille-Q1738]
MSEALPNSAFDGLIQERKGSSVAAVLEKAEANGWCLSGPLRASRLDILKNDVRISIYVFGQQLREFSHAVRTRGDEPFGTTRSADSVLEWLG